MLTGAAHFLTRARNRAWIRLWTRGGFALALTLGGLTWASGTAQAGVTPCDNGYVCLGAGSGGTLPVGSGGGSGGGGGSNVCRYGGNVVACYVPGVGWFDSADGCYYMKMQPQPPAGDPLWQGHQPSDGAVYDRTCPLNGGGGTVSVWMQQAPAPPATMTPGELAHWMFDKYGPLPARIASAPGEGPGQHGLVHMPVMFWIVGNGKDYVQTGDYGHTFVTKDHALWKSVSVPGYSVTAWLWSDGVSLDTGDGHTVDCGGPGTPFAGTFVAGCAHVYDTANAAYGVTAKVSWRVQWQASDGTHGDFHLDHSQGSNQLVLTINELQVLN